MSCGSGPIPRQVVKAIPMDAFSAPCEQLRGAAQTKFLHFLSAESRNAHFGDPEGKVRDFADFSKLIRPFIYGPMVPIQRKTVHSDHIDPFQHTLPLHI